MYDVRTFLYRNCDAEINKILKGIEKRWSKKVAYECRRKIQYTVLLVESNPFIGKRYGMYRRIVANKTLLFYKIVGDKIYIMHAFDSRQNWTSLLE